MFLGLLLSIEAPCSGGIFELWAHNSFLFSLTDTLCSILTFRLMKPRALFALDVILLICVLKFKLVDRSKQRYLAEETLSRVVLCIV